MNIVAHITVNMKTCTVRGAGGLLGHSYPRLSVLLLFFPVVVCEKELLMK